MHEIDLTTAEREECRWRILRALDAGRPRPVSESILLRTLEDIKLAVTPSELRKQLRYLEQRDLIKIGSVDAPTWTAELTVTGIDLVEYTIPCPPGIARPKKWY